MYRSIGATCIRGFQETGNLFRHQNLTSFAVALFPVVKAVLIDWEKVVKMGLGIMRRRGGLMFCICLFIYILVNSVRPIISTSTGLIFTKVAGLVELLPQMNELKLFFDTSTDLPWQLILWAKSTSNTHLVVRVTFARAAPPAYDNKGNCYAGRRQTNYLT